MTDREQMRLELIESISKDVSEWFIKEINNHYLPNMRHSKIVQIHDTYIRVKFPVPEYSEFISFSQLSTRWLHYTPDKIKADILFLIEIVQDWREQFREWDEHEQLQLISSNWMFWIE